jgi:midasin
MQGLARKVDSERSNLELLFKTATMEVKLCCTVSSDNLCHTYGFNGWLASLPLLNLKSLNLDTLLLQELSKCTHKDSSEAHEVPLFTSLVTKDHISFYSLFLSCIILHKE